MLFYCKLCIYRVSICKIITMPLGHRWAFWGTANQKSPDAFHVGSTNRWFGGFWNPFILIYVVEWPIWWTKFETAKQTDNRFRFYSRFRRLGSKRDFFFLFLRQVWPFKNLLCRPSFLTNIFFLEGCYLELTKMISDTMTCHFSCH